MQSSVKFSQMANPFFDPRICTYKLGSKIREHIDKLIVTETVEKSIKDILIEIMELEESKKNTLDYESLVKLHKYVQRADPEYTDPFYKFSDSCKCIEPNIRDNQNLDKRLKMLRLKNSQNIYNKMTRSVDKQVERKLEMMADSGDTGVSTVSEFKNLYGSLIAVFNSFLVYICTFVFCYKALEYSLPRPDVTLQVAFGFIGSFVVAIAEIYFLLRVV